MPLNQNQKAGIVSLLNKRIQLMNAPTKNIAAQVDWDSVDLELDRHGEKIILPDSPTAMTIPDGIKALKRIHEAQETVYGINETVHCHFYDGIVAFARALKEKYGYSQAVPTPGMFGPTPPHFVHVKTGPGITDFVQVPYGSFQLPNIEGVLKTEFAMSRGIPVLRISGKVKAKEKHIVMELVALTKKFSEEQSIYRSRSIILERDEKDGINFEEPLLFFDPHSGMEVPIFNEDTQHLIDVAIMAPIAKSADCRSMKIPLKRGILLEGPYGCGKTLTARQVARTANENGWTFILVTAATALRYALTFAKMYQPCVVFAEDIDRMVDERNEGANDLINEIDGVVGKNDEIITVLTTNFAERIDKAMLRPGRLDAVVSIRPPEAEAVKRLIRFYAGGRLDAKEDLSKPAAKLAGNIPATIREVVERSKLSMLHHGRDKITAEDLIVSADGMQNHLALIEKAKEGKREVPVLEDIFQTMLAKIVTKDGKAAAFKALEEYSEEYGF